jgi:ADP-heptose:LPS heptosyltransferase
MKHLAEKHEVEYNLGLLEPLGLEADKDLFLPLNDDIISKVSLKFNLRAMRPFVALHPWTSDKIKEWPLANFKSLADSLAARINVLIVGGSAEARGVFPNSGKGVVELCGRTSLAELAVILKEACLLISADSGPVHLAAAVKTPVLALFRNDIRAKSALRWGPWGQNHRVIEKPGLGQISVSEVLTAAKEMLKI